MFPELILGVIITTALSQKIGPYVINTEAMKLCEVTGRAAYRVPYTMVLYKENGVSLLRWNLTLPRRNVPLRGNVIMMSIENNPPNKVFELDEIVCQHFFLKTILKLSNFDPDKSVDCGMNKGLYYSEKIDPNRMAHLLSNTMPYGEYQVRLEWYFPRGVVACQEVRFRSVPIPKKTTS